MYCIRKLNCQLKFVDYIRTAVWPLLTLNLGSHLGVECFAEWGGQWAECRGQYHCLLGLRLNLVDLQDLPALGEALRGCDETSQSGCQRRGWRPVCTVPLCHWNCIWESVKEIKMDHFFLELYISSVTAMIQILLPMSHSWDLHSTLTSRVFNNNQVSRRRDIILHKNMVETICINSPNSAWTNHVNLYTLVCLPPCRLSGGQEQACILDHQHLYAQVNITEVY